MSIPPLHTHQPVPAMGAVSKSPAKQANDALAGPGPDGKGVRARDTDAYSQAQFAKPAIPRTKWNQTDQAARATGAQPTKCAAMQMVVGVTDTGLRCYRISITGWQTIVVVKDVD